MTDALAAQLLDARANGDHFPEAIAGTIDLAQALDLQLAVLQHQLDAGKTVGGWKVGLTSEASRKQLGADERPFGFVLDERVFDSGVTIDSSTITSLSIETEMCFTVGTDISDPTITPDQVLSYMSGVSAGFELNEARTGSTRPDFFAMVTDCLTNWGIVAGEPFLLADANHDHTPAQMAEKLSATVITMERNGVEVFRGISHDVVDDHTISLCRLIEQLAAHGQGLSAGQKIITGAFARFPTEPGDHWQANFADIGSVEAFVQPAPST